MRCWSVARGSDDPEDLGFFVGGDDSMRNVAAEVDGFLFAEDMGDASEMHDGLAAEHHHHLSLIHI